MASVPRDGERRDGRSYSCGIWLRLREDTRASCHHVRSHTGDSRNECADVLAEIGKMGVAGPFLNKALTTASDSEMSREVPLNERRSVLHDVHFGLGS